MCPYRFCTQTPLFKPHSDAVFYMFSKKLTKALDKLGFFGYNINVILPYNVVWGIEYLINNAERL